MVNSQLFFVARNGIHYFELTVYQDHLTVQKLLMNADVSFRIQVTESYACSGFTCCYLFSVSSDPAVSFIFKIRA